MKNVILSLFVFIVIQTKIDAQCGHELFTNIDVSYYGGGIIGDDFYFLSQGNDKFIGKLEQISTSPTPINNYTVVLDLEDDGQNYRHLKSFGGNLYVLNGNNILKIDLNATPVEATPFAQGTTVGADYLIASDESYLCKIQIASNPTRQQIVKINLSESPQTEDILIEIDEPAAYIFRPLLKNDRLYYSYFYGIFYIDLNTTPYTPVTHYSNGVYINSMNLDDDVNIYTSDHGSPDALLGVVNASEPENLVVAHIGCLGSNSGVSHIHNGYLYETGMTWRLSIEDILTPLSVQEADNNNPLKLSPNPSSAYVSISGLNSKENYTVYNVLGKIVASGQISSNENININHLETGVYFFKLDSFETITFIKK